MADVANRFQMLDEKCESVDELPVPIDMADRSLQQFRQPSMKTSWATDRRKVVVKPEATVRRALRRKWMGR